jgi:hypothetical protein
LLSEKTPPSLALRPDLDATSNFETVDRFGIRLWKLAEKKRGLNEPPGRGERRRGDDQDPPLDRL